MKFVLAISYFIVLTGLLAAWRPIDRRALMYGVVTLMLLIGLSAVNDSVGLIEEKVASFIAYDMYAGDRFQLQFLVQYFVAWIPFALTDNEYAAHGVNMGLQAFAFLLAAQHIFSGRLDWRLLVFLLFPSYYHYAIFGLRDPYINLLSVLVAISAFHLTKWQFIGMCVGLALLGIGIRPEFSLIILGFSAIRLYLGASRRRRVFIVLASFAGLYVMLLLLPYAFGFQSTGTATGNIAALEQFNELRANRRLNKDFGGGSAILGGVLYGYPLIVRYPIQVLASFVTPLPIDIRGALDILAFLESIVFCVVVWVAFRGRKKSDVAMLLFLCGMAYMLLQALFAANYGNTLRVRYPSLILFLASSIAATRLAPRRQPSASGRARRRGRRPISASGSGGNAARLRSR